MALRITPYPAYKSKHRTGVMKRKWTVIYDGTAKIKARTKKQAEERPSKMLPSYLPFFTGGVNYG